MIGNDASGNCDKKQRPEWNRKNISWQNTADFETRLLHQSDSLDRESVLAVKNRKVWIIFDVENWLLKSEKSGFDAEIAEKILNVI